jgi:Fe(3+) dicitrate transport protein
LRFFAENQFRLTDNLVQEFVLNTLLSGAGLFAVNNGSNVNFDAAPIVRNKALFGLGLEYKFTNIYHNITSTNTFL